MFINFLLRGRRTSSLDDMRRDLREKYERLKTAPWATVVSSNPNREVRPVTPTQVVEALVELMDWATLWRWKTAIDKRLEREKVDTERAQRVLETWMEELRRK